MKTKHRHKKNLKTKAKTKKKTKKIPMYHGTITATFDYNGLVEWHDDYVAFNGPPQGHTIDENTRSPANMATQNNPPQDQQPNCRSAISACFQGGWPNSAGLSESFSVSWPASGTYYMMDQGGTRSGSLTFTGNLKEYVLECNGDTLFEKLLDWLQFHQLNYPGAYPVPNSHFIEQVTVNILAEYHGFTEGQDIGYIYDYTKATTRHYEVQFSVQRGV